MEVNKIEANLLFYDRYCCFNWKLFIVSSQTKNKTIVVGLKAIKIIFHVHNIIIKTYLKNNALLFTT